jgi:hypothetical protein
MTKKKEKPFSMATVNGFLTSAANANKNGLVILLGCIEHMQAHGDRTLLERLLSKAPRNMQPTMRLIAGRVLVNYTMSTGDAKSETDRKITLKPAKGKNSGFDDVQLTKLRDMVGRKVSIASADVREAFKGAAEPKPVKDDAVVIATRAAAIAKWAQDNSIPLTDLIAALEKLPVVAAKVVGEPAH